MFIYFIYHRKKREGAGVEDGRDLLVGVADNSVEGELLDDLLDDLGGLGDGDLLLVGGLLFADEVLAVLEQGGDPALEAPKVGEPPRLDKERQQVPPLVQRLVDLPEADVHVAQRGLQRTRVLKVLLGRVVGREDPLLTRLQRAPF